MIGASSASCKCALSAFTSGICGELGVPIATEKTVGPVQVITYLGLEIDTLAQQVRVPENKVQVLCDKIHTVLGKHNIHMDLF